MRLQRGNLLRHNRLYSCCLLTSDAFVDVLIALMHSLHVFVLFRLNTGKLFLLGQFLLDSGRPPFFA
jgi:hypothetical protein